MWIIDFFKEDPLRLLTIIGGSGGIFYWYDRIKNRIRIKIRFIRLNKHLSNNKPYSITFEVENIGDIATSIEPTIILNGYIPPVMKKTKTTKFKRSTYIYEIDSLQRNLPPRKPVQFKAVCNSKDNEKPFLQLGFYVFRPAIGRKKIIYVKTESGSQLSIIKYLFYEAIYLFSNKLYIRLFC